MAARAPSTPSASTGRPKTLMPLQADYLGGDPAHPTSYDDGYGALSLGDGGDLVFTGSWLTGGLTSQKVTFTIPGTEIQAISVGDANRVKILTRAAIGSALAGGIGAVIGASSGQRDHVLMVAAVRDGFEFVVRFAVRGEDGMAFLNLLQKRRHDDGLPLMPSLEDLLGRDARDDAREQTEILRQMRDLMREQTRLLAKLAGEEPGPSR